jgi:hypothetical protein
MKSSADLFKNSLDKAFSQISLNSSTLQDHMKYKQGFTEEKLEGGVADDKSLSDIAKKHKVDVKVLTKQFDKGVKVEMEHTDDKEKAKEIAMDHISEDPKYYDKLSKMETNEIKHNESDQNDKEMVDGIIEIIKQIKDTSNRKEVAHNMIKKLKREKVDFDHVDFLKKCAFKQIKKSEPKEATGSGSVGAYSAPVFGGDDQFWERSRSETPKLEESEVEKVEAKEATTTGSSGGYETPAMWAKSTKKKDWGPSRKTQYKGGSFVKIKKKCTTFPYCNQGDITNLKLSKNESVKEAIKRVASKLNIDESVIITILEHEYQNKNKSNK